LQLLIGTYTRGTDAEGIYGADLDEESGQLTNLRLISQADNPTWLLSRGSRVIVANEFSDGSSGGEISVFQSSGGTLQLEQRLPSHGADPCHLACSTDRLAVANYSGSTVALYQWSDLGIGALVTLIEHQHTGTHPRQAAAHPHGVYFIGGELRVPDLGADRIYRYQPVDGRRLGEIEVAAGAGPRHLSADGNFLINELDNTVARIEGGSAELGCSTLPAGTTIMSSTAEIQQFGHLLYASNRVAHADGIITVFETRPVLRAVQHQTTAGKHPRHFIVDPAGRWLLVANRDSNNIVTLPLDADGRLGHSVAEMNCPSPVHLVPWR
jgi:6-phosphogluconolactonase